MFLATYWNQIFIKKFFIFFLKIKNISVDWNHMKITSFYELFIFLKFSFFGWNLGSSKNKPWFHTVWNTRWTFLKMWGPNQKLVHNSGVSSLFSHREPMTKGWQKGDKSRESIHCHLNALSIWMLLSPLLPLPFPPAIACSFVGARVDGWMDDKLSGNNFLLGSSSLANHGGYLCCSFNLSVC